LEGNVGYLVAIVFLVLALNIYITFKRISSTKKRNNSNRRTRVELDVEKQAIWRDKEIARRIAREQDDYLERIKLRDETLAFYEEVRRRHVFSDEPDKNNDTAIEITTVFNADTGFSDADIEPIGSVPDIEHDERR